MAITVRRDECNRTRSSRFDSWDPHKGFEMFTYKMKDKVRVIRDQTTRSWFRTTVLVPAGTIGEVTGLIRLDKQELVILTDFLSVNIPIEDVELV